MQRRKFIEGVIAVPVLSVAGSSFLASVAKAASPAVFTRVRPGDAGWPSPQQWEALNKAVNGNLIKIESPLKVCSDPTDNAACKELVKELTNPYFLGDEPALTQTSGWLDAWKSAPSVYAVAATSTSDVVAAINFARENKLRLVVKGGGHSYQGTSNSTDSLLIWTRKMNKIELHDNFIAQGCEGKEQPQPAVTIEAGAIWMHAYNAVTTKAGRYVQGGGCATVGVAGLIQSGGFGSFSKNYGLAAAALLEAEVVTADGKALVVNKCRHPDLFWALKGGGGGSFGAVTKLTLRTRELPEFFGVAVGVIKAKSDEAYKKLLAQIISFYHENLFNPHWGEQIRFNPRNIMRITMLFQGLNKQQATAVWQPLKEWVNNASEDFEWIEPLNIVALPAQHLWDADFLGNNAPAFVAKDDRPNAPKENIYWKGDGDEAGQFLYAYHSMWLPADFLKKENQAKLVNALFEARQHWTVSFHFNKGLAGAPEQEIEAAKDTATNPAVLTSFALAIIAGSGDTAYVTQPDLNNARTEAMRIDAAANELRKVVPNGGSYVSESNFFEHNWQQSSWGSNYSKLLKVKKRYDPEGLFFVHHGVGSEDWSDDGFTKIK